MYLIIPGDGAIGYGRGQLGQNGLVLVNPIEEERLFGGYNFLVEIFADKQQGAFQG